MDLIVTCTYKDRTLDLMVCIHSLYVVTGIVWFILPFAVLQTKNALTCNWSKVTCSM